MGSALEAVGYALPCRQSPTGRVPALPCGFALHTTRATRFNSKPNNRNVLAKESRQHAFHPALDAARRKSVFEAELRLERLQ